MAALAAIDPEEGDDVFASIAKFHSLYEIQDKTLGEGGYSIVKLATCKNNTAANVAVKIISRSELESKTEEFLRREVLIMKMMNHPGIVKLYGAFKDEDYYFVVLEYLAGGELFDRISEKVFYNESDARDIALSIMHALKYVHDNNVVHRDLKPENLLLSTQEDASLKLADFGFAVEVNGYSATDCCGSPEYMSPEVLKGIPYGLPSDMWSFGVILYILLGGYPPFYDTNQQKMWKLIMSGAFEFHEEYWGGVSDDAKDMIKRLLVTEQDQRIDINECFDHPWIQKSAVDLAAYDLNNAKTAIKKAQATKKLRVAVKTVMAVNRFQNIMGWGAEERRASTAEAAAVKAALPPPREFLEAAFFKKRRGSTSVFSRMLGADPAWKEETVRLDLKGKKVQYMDLEDRTKVAKELLLVRCHARSLDTKEAEGKSFAFGVFDSRNLELAILSAESALIRDDWVGEINKFGGSTV